MGFDILKALAKDGLRGLAVQFCPDEQRPVKAEEANSWRLTVRGNLIADNQNHLVAFEILDIKSVQSCVYAESLEMIAGRHRARGEQNREPEGELLGPKHAARRGNASLRGGLPPPDTAEEQRRELVAPAPSDWEGLVAAFASEESPPSAPPRASSEPDPSDANGPPTEAADPVEENVWDSVFASEDRPPSEDERLDSGDPASTNRKDLPL